MAAVVSKTTESSAVSDYFVSCLAGPKVARQRVEKGQKLSLTEHQARAELASGALVASADRVDDPWGEQEQAASAKAVADKAAADAKAIADKAASDAKAAAAKGGKPADPATPPAAN